MSPFAPKNIPTAEEIRELINGLDAIKSLNAIDQVLEVRGAHISKNEVAALALRVRIQFGKLAKVLPDLKSVEHNHQDAASRLADDEIRSRIAQLFGKARTPTPDAGTGSTH